jgi:hypothetical protein
MWLEIHSPLFYVSHDSLLDDQRSYFEYKFCTRLSNRQQKVQNVSSQLKQKAKTKQGVCQLA